MIRVGIVGATGYVGLELTRILSAHGGAQIAALVTSSQAGQRMSDIYPSLRPVVEQALEALNVEEIAQRCDVFFTSLPHGAGGEVIPALAATGKPVIDMSGDYRYTDLAVYEAWYKTRHPRPDLLAASVYGLPELHRESIAGSKLIGNPGCYTTCAILALAPLVEAGLIDLDRIVIDAKSGATGAGRAPTQALHFCELDESMKAYNVATHRHTSEIEQEVSALAGRAVQLSFTPHLLPIKRGILETLHLELTRPVDHAAVMAAYQRRYANEPFIVLHEAGSLPEIRHVVGSNFVHIGFVVDARLNRLIVVSCLDNLVKGAAGQAVQNMNLVFGLPETMGLQTPAWTL